MARLIFVVLLLAVSTGCASRRDRMVESADAGDGSAFRPTISSVDLDVDNASPAGLAVVPVSLESKASLGSDEPGKPEIVNADEPEADDGAVDIKAATNATADSDVTNAERPVAANVLLVDVIDSVHQSYPLVQAVFLEREIAAGNRVSAWGEFDTKLKAASENGPLGYYETYRNSAGFTTPLYGGGEVFGGYRNGGGDFQPWYKERETNDGGEFKAGVRVPLIRDRDIDSRRAQLWRATYDQQITDPVIRSNLVQFSREAGLIYWKWVAAGQKYQLGQQWLALATERNAKIERRVQLQDLNPPELIDNERAIAKREAKLADALSTLQQSAAKLSLFLRDDQGIPYLPTVDELPKFPPLRIVQLEHTQDDILQATQNRPELHALDLQLQRLRVDYAEAGNLTRPGLDFQLSGSQDVGQPTSSKRDKSEFELEAGLFFDVPLQQRKGRGKMQAVRAKMAQLSAKRRIVADKVTAEVQMVYAALVQSRQEALKARKAVELATQMASIERRKFEVGESDLLKVALREQYALEAAEEEISATYNHFIAFTEYAAALAIDRPAEDLLPAAAAATE